MWNNYRKRAAPFFIDRQEYSLERDYLSFHKIKRERKRVSPVGRAPALRKFISFDWRCNITGGNLIVPSVVCRERKLTRDQRRGHAPRITAIRPDGEIPSWCWAYRRWTISGLPGVTGKFRAGRFPKASCYTELFKARVMLLNTKLFRLFDSSTSQTAQKLIVAHPKFRFASPTMTVSRRYLTGLASRIRTEAKAGAALGRRWLMKTRM